MLLLGARFIVELKGVLHFLVCPQYWAGPLDPHLGGRALWHFYCFFPVESQPGSVNGLVPPAVVVDIGLVLI